MPEYQPLVSVLLPVYNAERFLSEAVKSIVGQSYPNLEIILIDDCSQDGSSAIIRRFAEEDSRIVALRNNENLKLSKTLNRAIYESKGKYLARMDADDISLATRIEKQVEFMESHQTHAVVGCNIRIIDEEGNKIGDRSYFNEDDEIRSKIFFFSPFCHPAIMIRKSMLDQAGYYLDVYNPAEDYELYFRLGKFGKFGNINECLFDYRVVSDSMTHGGTVKMEKQTILIRGKYAKSNHYDMPITARLYNLLHKVSIRLVSPELRVKVFYWIRRHIA